MVSVFVWCNVILPENHVSYCEDAKVSVRGSGSGNRRTQEKSSQRLIMERLFNPTLHRKSAEVCEVRHMCV